jgi:hypothetical protein
MKHVELCRVQLISGMGIFAALAGLSVAAPAGAEASVTVTSHFVITDDASTNGDSAYLDNGATDRQPHALLFLALNFTPGGVCGCALVEKPLGVWYDSSRSAWAVFNEDASSMPSAPSFNVLVVPKASTSVFVQHATKSNTHGNSTFLNSRLLNGEPKARIQVTQDFNPGGTLAGTFNPHAVGVRYFPRQRKWAILNIDGAHMPTGAAFNVLIGSAPSNGGTTALATETKGDRKIGTLVVSNALSNGNPNNVMFVTPNLSPNGKGRPGNPHPLEVNYPGTKIFRETIDNADFTVPPLNATFNLLIFSS